MKKLLTTATILACLFYHPVQADAPTKEQAVIQSYANLVYANYNNAYKDALALKKAIEIFLKEPNDTNLRQAKTAWLTARNSYGETEAFRFYEGPIDDSNGPEGQLNAWPLNEAYIDYVQGNPSAGIINDSNAPISRKALIAKNQSEDEADVSTGYHAIEFLLWGQDFSTEGPGTRPVSDYDRNTKTGKRRADYLRVITDLLVTDLESLVNAWEPNKDNYAKSFIAQPTQKSLGNILTSLATLSGFELASERMATSLDSGDQEDEHSCFSDNTHNDFIHNAKGIKNVFLAQYDDINNTTSLYELIRKKDASLADRITAQLNTTEQAIASIPQPFDREVLASPENSNARKLTETAIASLQKQADLFKEAGKVLGVDVVIAE